MVAFVGFPFPEKVKKVIVPANEFFGRMREMKGEEVWKSCLLLGSTEAWNVLVSIPPIFLPVGKLWGWGNTQSSA